MQFSRSGRRGLIMVSNRGPVEHYRDAGGILRQRAAGGGVAVALGSVAREREVTWLASSSCRADIEATARSTYLPYGEHSRLRFLRIDPSTYESFYGSFANPLLWFIQHGLGSYLDEATLRQAASSWMLGYVPVNQTFADAVVGEIDRGGSNQVMLHDYHFYLCARMIRRQRPDVALQHFTHIPWPEPAAWAILPPAMVARICRGLLGNDSVVFQTEESVENFLDTCRVYLHDDASVCSQQREVRHEGRTARVWANPISVDVDELKSLRTDPEVLRWDHLLRRDEDEKLIVRVDRLDPSKNVLRGFEAFEALLLHRSALRSKVRFVAYLVPTRESIDAYSDYAAEVYALAERINRRFGTATWKPVQIVSGNDRARALAGLKHYDVLLVNSLADGMNLVAKEGVVLNERDGVLVLSRTAGAFQELAGGAIGVRPDDVIGTALALDKALHMSPGERSERALRLRRAVESHQLQDWFCALENDLAITDYVSRPSPGVSPTPLRETVPA